MKTLKEVLAAHNSWVYWWHNSECVGIKCDCGWKSESYANPKPQHAAHVAAEIEKSLTVRTVEELDALPQGALIEHQGAVYRNRKFINLWQEVDWQRLDHDAAALLPARILWLPTDEATP